MQHRQVRDRPRRELFHRSSPREIATFHHFSVYRLTFAPFPTFQTFLPFEREKSLKNDKFSRALLSTESQVPQHARHKCHVRFPTLRYDRGWRISLKSPPRPRESQPQSPTHLAPLRTPADIPVLPQPRVTLFPLLSHVHNRTCVLHLVYYIVL